MPKALHVSVPTAFAIWCAQIHGVMVWLHEAELSCHKLLSLQPTAYNGPNMAHNSTVTVQTWMHNVMIYHRIYGI